MHGRRGLVLGQQQGPSRYRFPFLVRAFASDALTIPRLAGFSFDRSTRSQDEARAANCRMTTVYSIERGGAGRMRPKAGDLTDKRPVGRLPPRRPHRRAPENRPSHQPSGHLGRRFALGGAVMPVIRHRKGWSTGSRLIQRRPQAGRPASSKLPRVGSPPTDRRSQQGAQLLDGDLGNGSPRA